MGKVTKKASRGRVVWAKREEDGIILSLTKPRETGCGYGCCVAWDVGEDSLFLCEPRLFKMFKGVTDTPRKYRVTVEEVK